MKKQKKTAQYLMKFVDFDLHIRPRSKARPRSFMGQSRPYMDKAYMQWKKDVWSMASEYWTEEPIDYCHKFEVIFYTAARGDIDNLLGGLFDALTSSKDTERLFTDDNVKVISEVHCYWKHEPKVDKAHVWFRVYY